MKDDELLDISFQSLEYPELVYKTSRYSEIAAFSSVLTFLFVVITIQTNQGLDAFQFILVIGPTLLALCISLLFFARTLISFITAEFNRRENSVLFANSILAKETDSASTNYQRYNIRVLHTHISGPYPLYIALIAMAVSLFIVQIIIDSSGEILSGNMLFVFGLIISGTPFTMVTFTALVILGIGILGLGLRIFSDVNIKRWKSKSETQIHAEAEKLVSTATRTVQMTYEEAIKIFEDAENGNSTAIEQKEAMTEGMNREISHLRKMRLVYILAIIIVSIIDVVIFLLP
jgi:hypothetical protein